MKKEINFSFEKATKRTYRFTETPLPGEPVIIGTIYIQKHIFKGEPGQISIIIDTKED